MSDERTGFADDYFESRDRFCTAARARNIIVNNLPIDACGPDDEALSIDIARQGRDPGAPVLLLQSGVHGVEAFAGAALQLQCLTAQQGRPGVNVILVHVLNPYGAAWWRRVNENNVDLNRNCLEHPDDYAGAAPGYRSLGRLLNPESPPCFDAFHLRAAAQVLRRGRRAAIQAVALGQYDYPRGLFFGGHGLEMGPRLYRDWLRHNLSGCGRVLVLDLHTGLGRRGQMSIFRESPLRRDSLADTFAPWWIADSPASPGYDIRGGVAQLFDQALPERPLDYLTVEFGTYSPLRILHALREENRWHFYGDGSPAHPTKDRLREALCPADSNWRAAVLTQGRELIDRALEYLVVGAKDYPE